MKSLHHIKEGLSFAAMILVCVGLPAWAEFFLN